MRDGIEEETGNGDERYFTCLLYTSNVVHAIKRHARRVLAVWLKVLVMTTGIQEKVMPIASASMLVATARKNMVLNPNSALEVFSSSESDSRIILAPISTKRKKAIHAENVST